MSQPCCPFVRLGLVAAVVTAGLGSALACATPEPAPTVASTPPTAAAAPPPAEATDDPPLATIDAELAMKNPAMPRPGLLTGGQPTPADLEVLAAQGFRTVINLRAPDEAGQEGEAEAVAALGMDYVALPIANADELTADNARALAAVLDDPARQPVLLHCGSSNRVGALLALAAFHVDGASAEDALDLGRSGGLRSLEDAVRERLVPVADD